MFWSPKLTLCMVLYIQGSKILEKLNESTLREESSDAGDTSKLDEKTSKSEPSSPKDQTDYSSLFGEKNSLLASEFNCCIMNIDILDLSAVEEGILHILFSCAAQVNYVLFL